jgi:flagellar biosynthesis/type III secretory pathway protein FliH
MIVWPGVVAREFKPLRFFVMMAVAAFVVCGVTAFYTHRAAHGRTPEERAAYAIGEKAGEEAPAGAKLPTAAELNIMAQKYFKQQGSGNQQDWDLAFENGYEEGFKKTHPRQ